MYYAGVDLGATNISVVVGTEPDEPAESAEPVESVGSETRATPPGPTGADVTQAIVSAIDAACEAAGIAPTDLTAVGVGAAGGLDPDTGAVMGLANLPDTVSSIPLTGPIADLIGGRSDAVSLYKDTTAGVIGERFATPRDVENLVYLTISSGIGAGVCIDGQVLSGWHGNVGEIGHTTIDPDGRMTCGCGRTGHWEAYCSGNNIPRYARHLYRNRSAEAPLPSDAARPAETALPIESEGFSARDVFDHAETDAFAATVLDRVADWNAIGVANLITSYDPEVVRIGGAVTLNNPERTIDSVRERLTEELLFEPPTVEATRLGDDAVVTGALTSAIIDQKGRR